jgi:hypothetical protein
MIPYIKSIKITLKNCLHVIDSNDTYHIITCNNIHHKINQLNFNDDQLKLIHNHLKDVTS